MEDQGHKFELILFTNESEMLSQTFKLMKNYPFWITFNGDEFDLLYLYHRAKHLGLKNEDIPFFIEKTYKEVIAHPKNGIHIDLFKVFSTGLMTYAFPQVSRGPSLEELGQAILGYGKLASPDFTRFSEELATYCFRDSRMTLEVTTIDNSVTINIIILVARIYNLPLEELTRTYLLYANESLFKWIHRTVNFLIPDIKPLQEKDSLPVPKSKTAKYKGAVIECEPGTYFGVGDWDFTSLYPGNFDKHNLSYETVNCPHQECKSNVVPEHEIHVCKIYEGIIGAFLGAVRELRMEYKKQAKTSSEFKAITGALKICLLSFYGLFGSEKTTLKCLPVASACTAYSRTSLLTAKSIAKKYASLQE